MAEVINVSDENFYELVANSEIPVFLGFWVEWSPQCKKADPLLTELAAEYSGRMTVAKIDTDASREIPRQYSVTTIPTFILFYGGEVVDSLRFIRSYDDLTRFMNNNSDSLRF